MKKTWMTVEAYLARPGSELPLTKSGTRFLAALDPSADMTTVPEKVVRAVYGETVPQFVREVSVKSLSGSTTLHTVPLLVGLVFDNLELAHAQVECLVVPGNQLAVGSDILSLLGLEVHFDYERKRLHLERYTWEKFEDEVASVFRMLGASVQQNVNLAGFQIDTVVRENTQSGRQLRIAVECKFYKDRLGNRLVNDFARVVETLKSAGLVDRGIIVSYKGFTQDANLVAENTHIELLTLADLRQRLPETASSVQPTSERSRQRRSEETSPAQPKSEKRQESKRESLPVIHKCFVVMPFTAELDDIYHLGIRETVNAIGSACERADEIQHTGGIIEKVYDSIRGASVVIAEVTNPNPNVYYEIGFAHALDKPVVLLTRNVSGAPFDLRGYNHIIYSSIVELREKLQTMLGEILK